MIRKSSHLDFIMCLLLLVASGNPIFVMSDYIREFYVLLLGLSFYYCHKKNINFISKCFNYSFPFIAVFLLQHFFLDGMSISSQIFSLVRIFIGVAILKGLGANFVSTYSKVMTIIALISLIGLSINGIFGLVPSIQIEKIHYSLILYTQLYSDFGGIELRNCGMFWEPGAYQGYLNIAIGFVLLMPHNKDRRNSLIILIIALLTTQSTTGYLVFSFIIILYSYKFSHLSSSYRCVVVLFVIGLCLLAYFKLDFMQSKITENLSDTDTPQGRVTDFIIYSKLISENFFLGINTETLKVVTGNGVIYSILYYGGIATLYYFGCLWFSFLRKFNFWKALYLFGIILISLQGEVFNFYPLYIAMPVALMNFTHKFSLSIRKQYER